MEAKEVKKEAVLVNEELMEEAFKIGSTQKLNSKEAIVTQAIQEFLEKRRKMQNLFNQFGTVEYFEGYNYKDAR